MIIAFNFELRTQNYLFSEFFFQNEHAGKILKITYTHLVVNKFIGKC